MQCRTRGNEIDSGRVGCGGASTAASLCRCIQGWLSSWQRRLRALPLLGAKGRYSCAVCARAQPLCLRMSQPAMQTVEIGANKAHSSLDGGQVATVLHVTALDTAACAVVVSQSRARVHPLQRWP